MYLFFDTETNGVPKNMAAPITDIDNWPRITQLAWVLYDGLFNEIDRDSVLIKPDGWTIPTDQFFVDNGMSTERNEQHGVPISDALQKFIGAVNRCELMVAHNLSFDLPIASAEMYRLQYRANKKPEKFCTMKGTMNLVKATNKLGRLKWPNLTELHVFTFGKGFDGAHDALADVRACANCFFELVNLGLLADPLDKTAQI